MKWLCERLYRKEKGFTLIELLIVIIILAVLAGIAIPSYLSITNRAKSSATQAEMAGIATALEMYNADTGAYPATGLTAMVSALEGGGYMQTVPTVDKWNTDYTYVLSAGVYTLTSTGGSSDIVFMNGQMTSPATTTAAPPTT
ncbi:MAG: type II secretion system protein GspG [Candidatus Humimicrobiaceae bacterium]